MKYLDLEPLKIYPSTNGTQGYKTNLGGLSFIIISILTGLAIFAFGREIVEKKNPSVISSEMYDSFPSIEGKQMYLAFSAFLKGGFTIPELSRYISLIITTADTDGQSKTFYNFSNF